MNRNTMNQTTTNNTAEELYTNNGKRVYIALRARHQHTAQEFITNLQNQWKNDENAMNTPRVAEQITELENRTAELENRTAELKGLITLCKKQGSTIALEPTTRTAFAQQMKIYNEQINILKTQKQHIKNQIDTLYKQIEKSVFSDRMDILQTACLQELENQAQPPEISSHILATYGATTTEELTAEELTQAQDEQNNKSIFSAIGKHIENMRSLNTHTATRTDILEMLPCDIVEQLGNDIISFNGYTFQWQPKATDPTQGEYRHNLKNGHYLTIEYKEQKSRPIGWYMVKHRLTIRNVSSMEQYQNEDGEQIDITALLPNFTEWELVDDITALENIINTAELPPRYRQFCTALISPQAEEIADIMRVKYYNECDRIGTEPTNKGAVKTEYNARIQFACESIGIKTYENRKKFFQRLRKALNK